MKYATVVTSILILIAVLVPGSDLPDVSIGAFDKLIHIGMFALWAVAVRYDYNKTPFPFASVLIAGVIFSGLTEIVQLLVEGRSFDIYDMIADCVGLVLGLILSGPIVKGIKQNS